MTEKLVLLGLDGATFDLIRPWSKQGKLPNFEKIMRDGSWGQLKSTTPPVTAPAWPAIYTGKNPGKLGVFYFEKEQKGTYEPLIGHASEYDGKDFWEIIGEANFKTGVVNCPMTYPPTPINGFLISNAPSPETEYCYPPELKAEIADKYKLNCMRFYGKTEDEYLKDIFDMVNKKIETTKFLMEKKEWDFFFFTINSTDTLQHFFFSYMFEKIVGKKKKEKYGDAILRMYQTADDFIGYLIEKKYNIFVVSDHGAGFWDLEKPARIFYANKWLADEGMLKEKMSAKTISLFSKLGLSPTNVYRGLRKVGIDMRKYIPKEKQDRIIKPVASIDYPNTKVWLRINFSNFGGFRINLEGREASGAVGTEEYETFREELIGKLRALKDPGTGREVMSNVWKREEIYHGPYIDDAPDIIFEMIDNYTTMRMTSARPFENVKNLSGFHKMNGIFIAYGPDIAKGRSIENASVMDVSPTILHTFGLSIPKNVDGRVLTEIFRDASDISKQGIKFTKIEEMNKEKSQVVKISKEDEEKIKQKLEDLGYI
jgi:predicted AlkP superfamily phosphohydrolase/phosphomutase